MLASIWAWFMSPTNDGATHLQAVILSVALVLVLWFFIREVSTTISDFIKEVNNNDAD